MGNIRFQFLHFELSPAAYELRCNNEPVKLERLPMELLVLLIEHRGELVTREMIIERLWGTDVFLETEHSINTAINKLRAILQDSPRQPKIIQTVVGKGYRFIAEVKVTELSALPTNSEAEPASSVVHATAETANRLITRKKLGKRTILALCCSTILFTAALFYLIHRHNAQIKPDTATRFRSVAVLPFLSLSPDSDKEYLVDGATDQLITLLAQDTSLRVISRTSAMQFKGVRKPLPEIAAALDVDAIVEGSILRSSNGTRITAQLLDARHDRHLWAQSYQLKEADSLNQQDIVTADIALQVLHALTNQASLAVPQVQQHIANAQARDLFLRGGYFWHQRTLDAINKAIDYYNQAILADPNFPEAYAALGQAYVIVSSYGGPGPAKPLLQAREAAQKSLQLNSRLGEAHTVLAAVKVDLDWDWVGAEQEYRRAVELNPNDSTAHHWFALHLSRLHRFQEAEVEMQRALELDPVSTIVQTDAAEIAYEARQPQEAEKRLRRALELDQNFAEAHLVLGKIYEEQGQQQSALAEFQRASQLFGAAPNIEALRGHAMARLGRTKEAETIAANLEAQSHLRYVSGVDMALLYCGLNDQDKAMRWLERGLREHDKGMDTLATEPLFDNCRKNPADPRFEDMLRRLKLL